MFENNQVTPEQENNEGNAAPQPQGNTSPFDTLLSEIRNDRGEPKYKSVEDGLNALKHSQEHIRSLTQERQRMEQQIAELEKKTIEIESLKEAVTKLAQRGSEPAQPGNQFDEEAIATLVDNRLTKKQQEEAAASNQRAVAGRLHEVFGDKARDTFYEKASQLGFSPDEFEALAAKSPKAVLTMLNIDGDGARRQPNKSPVPSQLNTEKFQGRPNSFIGAETERIPLGGGDAQLKRILENSQNMVKELNDNGMSVYDLTDPVKYMQYIKNKG